MMKMAAVNENGGSDNKGKATGLTTAGGGPGAEPSLYIVSHHCSTSSFVYCSFSPGGGPGQEPDRQPAATSLSGEDSSCSTHGPCF